jgi:hypothetical protein
MTNLEELQAEAEKAQAELILAKNADYMKNRVLADLNALAKAAGLYGENYDVFIGPGDEIEPKVKEVIESVKRTRDNYTASLWPKGGVC